MGQQKPSDKRRDENINFNKNSRKYQCATPSKIAKYYKKADT